MRHNILTIGELLWDKLPDKTLLGGAPANLAFRLVERGCDCHLISRLGMDDPGYKALECIEDMNIPTSLIQFDPNFPTGTVIVEFDENKTPDYLITPKVAYDFIELLPELETAAANCHCIAFGTLAQRNNKSRQTIYSLLQNASKAIKFLDINLRKDCYSTGTISQSLYFADVLKANHHEAFQLNSFFGLTGSDIPEICEIISERFDIKTILVTIEQNGVFLYDRKEGRHYIAGHRISVEDSLGSGDAFSAGFIDELLKGSSLARASETGNILGAIVASKKGATQKITKTEIEKIISRNNRIVDPDLRNYLFIPT